MHDSGFDTDLSNITIELISFFAIIMIITIQKSLQLYYKQKLLVQELDATKEKLEEKIKEVEGLEKDNIEISKKNHTIIHKQNSLEHKIDEMLMKTEISKEEAGEIRDRLKAIEKEANKEKTVIELDKTEIQQIDDMLKYMQSECSKNNIDFELQLKGNIHYMTNNLITKEDLETLIADHIKNAIIAIKHTENINRSILVRLGMIDENYALYIYDSGIEFEKETLENLGKKPSTTHKDESLLCCAKKESELPFASNTTQHDFHFDERVCDSDFLSIVANYMRKYACAPVEEAQKLIDMMHPTWKGKYEDYSTHKADATQLWQVNRERKYQNAPRASVAECRMIDMYVQLIAAAKIYSVDVLNGYRGMTVLDGNKVVISFSRRDIPDALEVDYFGSWAVAVRNKFGNDVQLEYRISNG